MVLKTLLVVGATGQQGGALIDALHERHSDWKIYGLTRNISSLAANKLRERNVTIIKGDMLEPKSVFSKIGEKVGVVFAMTQLGEKEEEGGKAMVDCAISNDVEHFIFTSVDRGGPTKSPNEPTLVPHFITKHNIEKYLIEKTRASGNQMRWTILRPVTFMDNFAPGFMCGFISRILEQMNGLRLQLVSVKDIGKVAGLILLDMKLYNGKALTLAADSVDYESACATFRSELDMELPTVPVQALPLVGAARNDERTEDIAKMVQWFYGGGYNSNLDEVQGQWPNGDPKLDDFPTWLRTSSKWVKSGDRS